MLAATATGIGQAALLSADLRRLDVDTIARLAAAGVAVVGLVEPGDERAADRLRALGVGVLRGVVAQVLGLLDESAGLAAAARQAAAGILDEDALGRLAWSVHPRLSVLTGLARADRWLELRPRVVAAVLEEARRGAELTVVDCASSLEEDEELSYDTAAPRRNGATLAVLEAADTVICVSGADPVALQRSIRALGALRDGLPRVEPVLVVNQAARPGTGEPEAGDRRGLRAVLRSRRRLLPAGGPPLDGCGADHRSHPGRGRAGIATATRDAGVGRGGHGRARTGGSNAGSESVAGPADPLPSESRPARVPVRWRTSAFRSGAPGGLPHARGVTA